MLFFSGDYKINTPFIQVADPTVYSGGYRAIIVNEATRGFTTFQPFGGSAVISNTPLGSQIPASLVTIFETSKCPVQTSYTFQVQNAFNITIASATFSCTTTYSTNSIVVDLSGQNGKSLGFGWSRVLLTRLTHSVDCRLFLIQFRLTIGGPNRVAKNCLLEQTSLILVFLPPGSTPLPNTLGCLDFYDHTPCTLAKVSPANYTQVLVIREI